jgi:RNA polymerase sigma factor (sigma-70 family)
MTRTGCFTPACHSMINSWPTMRTHSDGHAVATTTAVLQAAQAGDSRAWEELLRRYGDLVRAAVARYRLNAGDSADAVQNTWLRLIERATTIRDPEKLGGWLATTARRECLALIRRQRIECPLATIDTGWPSPEPTPEAMAITSETRRHVRSATNTLADRPRALIDALYYRPCSDYAEVARRTGMPIGSIGPTRLRTLRGLHHVLCGFQP